MPAGFVPNIEKLIHYFPELPEAKIELFQKALVLYREWNDKINLVSRKDADYITERHLLHSLSIAKYIQFRPGTKVMDLGTGGGFPGIPLAILFDDVQFHLVDSIGKKIKAVNSIIQELGLENAIGMQKRAEEVNNKYDFIVSRAVAPISTLHHWSGKLISKKNRNTISNGFIMLKGGDLNQEIKDSKLLCELMPLSNFYKEPFFETKKLVYCAIKN